jgi:hypothetical protein
VSVQPTLLEDCLDPWLAVEPDRDRRETVIRSLMALSDAEGLWDNARPVPGTKLPAFAAMVPGARVVVVWVIAERYSQLAIRYLYDISNGQRFGG